MNSIKSILSQNKHRPYPIPMQDWKYYQEWHDVLFAHWRVPVKDLYPLIPSGLELDLFDGVAWISMVAFSIKKLRPQYFPAFPFISNFHELNIRTYVKNNNKPGIYFLSIEAEKNSSVFLARLATGLHYTKSEIIRSNHLYKSHNKKLQYNMELSYAPLSKDYKKDQLDCWLTERYCVFHEKVGKIFAHDVHHIEWPIHSVNVDSFNIHYAYNNLLLHNVPALRYHYSKGVNVLTWGKQIVG